MNKLTAYLTKWGCSLLAAAAVCGTAACDDAIYDHEGDCGVSYSLKFRYDMNMKWADAFRNEVNSVNLYAFDKSGTLVWQQTVSGDPLRQEGFELPLDVPAGDYRLLAWCGIENGGADQESFSVPDATVGVTKIGDLRCSLYRDHDADGAFSDKRLFPLFHGMLDVSLPADDNGGDYSFTMPLTKDTNHVRVILQHLSGEPVDEKKFTFRIEEENGLMDFDNSLLPDEKITYRAHDVKAGTAGMGIDDYPEMGDEKAAQSSPAVSSVSVAIADLTTARLVEGRHTYLTVETTDGVTAARIPLTDYALLLKDGYGKVMTDQEYLDRQDEYSLTFFLDDNENWIASSIIINSWKVVLNNVDF